MATSTGTHKVTEAEWKLCEKLGFVIDSHSSKVSIVDFINSNFSGLELLVFLTNIDELLKPMTAKQVYKVVSFSDKEPHEFIVQYFSEDHDDDLNGLALSRTLVKGKTSKQAIHDFFRIPFGSRNQGHGKTILGYCLQQYLNMGVDIIKVHASLADGGYVWAKAHFTATNKSEVSLILAKAKLSLTDIQFQDVKAVYNNYYSQNPDGKAFPINKWSNMDGMDKILRQSDWHGEVDLNNQELLTKFKNYVTRQE